MAGHNKWSKVKHIKAKTDAQKGKAFSKVVREIIVAAKNGGGDPSMNAALRLAIQKAKDVNMPKDNVKRAIEKGCGGGEGTNLEEITYEAYGPGGVAILIDTLTDNRNRTIPNIRTIVSKAGGNMANQGSVAYLFETRGLILFDSDADEEKVMEIATENGAEDIDIQDDGSIEVQVSPQEYEPVRQAFEDAGIVYLSADLSKVPQTQTPLDETFARKVFKLIEALEEDDDVQNVYSNYQVSDDIMETILE
ncbi:YebC/PmpR family DNA-binding transcriptional regulator [Candidatus Marinamargulisbacteria bacterium SCGC AG-439-L15]|nr:YebC/PmpR family DNA-binding transcriptional regulator [Candidatus Marinamargulisbacteria bacterium SCGC AG-439-L15]